MFYWKRHHSLKFIRNYIPGSKGVFSISSQVKILMISLVSSLSLKFYFKSLVYDRNIFGSSSEVFVNFRKMFGNVRLAFGTILENRRKVVRNGKSSKSRHHSLARRYGFYVLVGKTISHSFAYLLATV